MTRLRGHHLFCVTLFQGSGYDQAFTAQMERTLAALEAGEDFTLCAGPDSLCAACPNLRPGERCAHGTSDVARRDAAALAAVGLQPGQRLSPSQAGERLRQVTESQWESVCAGCRWRKAGLCSWVCSKGCAPSALYSLLKEGAVSWKNQGRAPSFFISLLLSGGEYTKIGVDNL